MGCLLRLGTVCIKEKLDTKVGNAIELEACHSGALLTKIGGTLFKGQPAIGALPMRLRCILGLVMLAIFL